MKKAWLLGKRLVPVVLLLCVMVFGMGQSGGGCATTMNDLNAMNYGIMSRDPSYTPQQRAAFAGFSQFSAVQAQREHERDIADRMKPEVNVNVNNPSGNNSNRGSEQSGGPSWYDGKLTGGETYRGQVMNRFPHGNGQMTWPTGESFTGDFYQGRPHGRGTMIYRDGSKYDGDWRNGQRSGSGIFTGKDGSKYDGEWLSDVCHGKGTQTSVDGAVFEGDFKDGKPSRGTANLPNRTVISGIWGDTNRGTIRYPDGRVYEGEWDGNPLPGTQPSPGVWTEERPNGLGSMTFPDGGKKDGYWRQGEYMGRLMKE